MYIVHNKIIQPNTTSLLKNLNLRIRIRIITNLQLFTSHLHRESNIVIIDYLSSIHVDNINSCFVTIKFY
jgi:hypothetical protein